MKNLFFLILFIFATVIFSCKKASKNNNPTYTLAELQHKWMLVSHNGEALRYVGTPGDYYNFSPDNFLYRYVNKTYDTLAYILLPDNKTLSFYPVTNGSRSILATNYDIKVLDNNHLVLGTDFDVTTNVLDSLKR